MADVESGIEGNLPKWNGASAVYSRAYELMKKHSADKDLIEALGSGDEERIKSILLYRYPNDVRVKFMEF